MPIMNVNYRTGDLGETAKADLARKLTDVMIRMEGGANTHGGRAFAWVMFNELAVGNWWAGGETGDAYVSPPGRFLVHVSIPEGYMNAAHKGEVQAWVTEAILDVTSANEDRGTKSKPIPGPHQVYGFLTTAPNAVLNQSRRGVPTPIGEPSH
jgi:phenylpyruvate tautomerase PptA (4-oxalocrotonate tautomerase family)